MGNNIAIIGVGDYHGLSAETKAKIMDALNGADVRMILEDELTLQKEKEEYEIKMLTTPIEPVYCFIEDNKHKNQPWAKRGKNIKC